MNWQVISVNADWTGYLYQGHPIFDRTFLSVLKFKSPGLAPVQTEKGWEIIDVSGFSPFHRLFKHAWGYYEEACAVEDATGYFHLSADGDDLYPQRYRWCGNFQEGKCTVRDHQGTYHHIRPDGSRLYDESYQYAGDFKDGCACVMLQNGRFRHIDHKGNPMYPHQYLDLGIFHKGIATAKDERGWCHINRMGQPLYPERFAVLEPFYNGRAFAETLAGIKMTILQQD